MSTGLGNSVFRPGFVYVLRTYVSRFMFVFCCCCLFVCFLGKVMAWGCGPCVGSGSVDATAVKPQIIQALQPVTVTDIAAGDSHCLALTQGRLTAVY